MNYILQDNDIYLYMPAIGAAKQLAMSVMDWEWSLVFKSHRPKPPYASTIHIIHERNYNGDVLMTTRRGKNGTADTKQPDFIGFVNIRLNDEELAHVDAAMKAKTGVKLEEQLDYLLDYGKLSMNYVKGSMNVTLTVLEGTSKGLACSAFSDGMTEAVLMLRMKVEKYLAEFPRLYAEGGTKTRRG